MTPARLVAVVLLLAAAACRPDSPGVAGPDTSLAPPPDLSATPVAPGRIELTWSSPSSAETTVASYRLYRDGEVVAEPAATEHVDEGLTPFTEYAYRVAAVDSSGAESDPSASVTARTLDGSAPSAPASLEARSTGPSEVRLVWSSASDDETGIEGYRVYRDGAVVDSPTDTVLTDDGVAPSTKYVYEVSAVNGQGMEGPESEAATATTERAEDESPPTAPDDLEAEAVGTTEVLLTWSPSEDPQTGIGEYRIYRDGSRVGTASGTSFTDDGLEPDTEYEYEVSAVNGEGTEGPRSDAASATTESAEDESPPSTPDDLEAEADGTTEIDLSWSAAEDPESGIAEYRIYRDGEVVGATDDTDFEDEGLEPGTEYTYRVSAVNGEGLEGPSSDPASATTEEEVDGTEPTAPDSLSAEAAGTSEVDLSWSAAEDPESGVSEYRVYRDGSQVGTTPETTFTDSGLEPGTEYTYEVSAVNGEGLEGPRSDPATATTDEEGGG